MRYHPVFGFNLPCQQLPYCSLVLQLCNCEGNPIHMTVEAVVADQVWNFMYIIEIKIMSWRVGYGPGLDQLCGLVWLRMSCLLMERDQIEHSCISVHSSSRAVHVHEQPIFAPDTIHLRHTDEQSWPEIAAWADRGLNRASPRSPLRERSLLLWSDVSLLADSLICRLYPERRHPRRRLCCT